MPKLKGGLSSIANCVEYPEDAKKAGIEGRVIVQFIVNEQGKVESPQVIRGIGAGADEESIRCVKQAEFEPGKQRGKPVRVQYSLPVVYKLPGSLEEEKGSAYMEEPKHEPQKFTASISESTNGSISGKITDDETGNPIPGVNIVVKNTNTGTITDQDGEFTLSGISAGQQELMFSHIQYGTMTVQVQEN
ncbi:MAG: TonB family protein [Balneolaceae bacterium]|nr:TonB family protein [Balneolaceae bacterium]